MLSIAIPTNVKVTWGDTYIKVEGPLGILIKKRGNFNLAVKDQKLYVWEDTLANTSEEKSHVFLKMIASLMEGVSKGFRQKLKLVGVGFKGFVKDNILSLKIGYSHEVTYEIPTDIKISASKAKGTLLLISGLELYRVKQIAADIRKLRIPDSYKGKGIHFDGEILKLKKGKREGK